MTAIPAAIPATASRLVAARPARTRDAHRIVELIGAWAHRSLTLSRTLDDVLASLDDFRVAGREDGVIACGALHTIAPGLGEVRSVAVDRAVLGSGAGRTVVQSLLDLARDRGQLRVALLSKTPEFFARLGFATVDPGDLPEAYLRRSILAAGRSFTGRSAMMIDL